MENNKLTFEEFMKLPEKEKGEAYKNLSKEDKFKARLSQPVGGRTIGYVEYTDEERIKNKESFLKFLKEKGVTKN